MSKMSDELKELLPCPFCGNTRLMGGRKSVASHCVCCRACHAEIETPHLATAIEKWNTRASQWIPVGERKPEKASDQLSAPVLLFCDDGPIVGYWDFRYKGWRSRGFNIVSVTHWRELPTPPKNQAK